LGDPPRDQGKRLLSTDDVQYDRLGAGEREERAVGLRTRIRDELRKGREERLQQRLRKRKARDKELRDGFPSGRGSIGWGPFR
jgi:hypothetical protein